jgi:hypothetical protein
VDRLKREYAQARVRLLGTTSHPAALPQDV